MRDYPLRSLDALHLAVAEIAAVPLLEPGEQLGFASRDEAQRGAAAALGFVDIWPPVQEAETRSASNAAGRSSSP